MSAQVQAILFDLDGTLLDTAPDLANALNAVLQANGKPALPYEKIRPVVSHGGAALIKLGFALDPGHKNFEALRKQLLDYYLAHIADETRLFPGMEKVLDSIEQRGLRWGVVTNKPGWLTEPLMDALNLSQRAAGIVSGDTLKERKPHPAPLLHACKIIACNPERSLYIGDAQRDIEAGKNAGMITLVAMFGYLMETDDPAEWCADALIETPEEILPWIRQRHSL